MSDWALPAVIALAALAAIFAGTTVFFYRKANGAVGAPTSSEFSKENPLNKKKSGVKKSDDDDNDEDEDDESKEEEEDSEEPEGAEDDKDDDEEEEVEEEAEEEEEEEEEEAPKPIKKVRFRAQLHEIRSTLFNLTPYSRALVTLPLSKFHAGQRWKSRACTCS